jgi:hypothetical protein
MALYAFDNTYKMSRLHAYLGKIIFHYVLDENLIATMQTWPDIEPRHFHFLPSSFSFRVANKVKILEVERKFFDVRIV